MALQWIRSPNKDKGRERHRPEAIVIHIIEGTLKGTGSWFLNEESGVSAHYGIGKDGEIHQYVGKVIERGMPAVLPAQPDDY
jgi:N-acetyl-anhydromuramyl-L-alanine amidase AmpD